MEEAAARPVEVIKVPYAAKWTARMHDSFGTAANIGTPGGSNNSTSSNSTSNNSSTISGDAHSNHSSNASGESGASFSVAGGVGDTAAPASVLACGNDVSSVVASVRECDWTFSSDYICTILHAAASTATTNTPTPTSAATDSRAPADATATTSSAVEGRNNIVGGVVLRAHSLPTEQPLPLYTAFSTTYPTTSSYNISSNTTSKNTTGVVPLEWLVEANHSSGIDFEMLKSQNEPILFYDEFILYQVHIYMPQHSTSYFYWKLLICQ